MDNSQNRRTYGSAESRKKPRQKSQPTTKNCRHDNDHKKKINNKINVTLSIYS